MADNIDINEFEEFLKNDNVSLSDILDEYLEVQPSLFLELNNESRDFIYNLSLNNNSRIRKRLVGLLVDIFNNEYDDARISNLSDLGNLKLLYFGSIYTNFRSPREQLSTASLILSFIDYNKTFRFTPDDILDLSRTDDKILSDKLHDIVSNMPDLEQLRYLDFASEEVKINQKSCCRHIAEKAVFKPGEETKITVLVLGEAGAGKSTLVNESFRNDISEDFKCREAVGEHSITSEISGLTVTYTRNVSNDEIENGFDKDTTLNVDITMVDSPGLTREDMKDSTKMCNLAASIFQRISDGLNGKALPIDIILWVVPGSTSRLPKMDELFIRQLGALVPVCLVWTRALLSNHIEEFTKWLNNRKEVPVPLPLSGKFSVYARREKVRVGYQESFGMAELGIGLANVFNIDSHEMRDRYSNKHKDWTEADFEARRLRSYRIVKYHCAAAACIGATPIPYVDTVAVFMLQSAMIIQINAEYGAALPNNILSSLITTIISGSASLTALGVVSLAGAALLDFASDTLKLIPGLNFIGMALSAGTAAGLTAAVGCAFVNGVEKCSRDYPNLLSVPTDTIEKALLAEAEEQAKFSLNETRKKVDNIVGPEDDKQE